MVIHKELHFFPQGDVDSEQFKETAVYSHLYIVGADTVLVPEEEVADTGVQWYQATRKASHGDTAEESDVRNDQLTMF